MTLVSSLDYLFMFSAETSRVYGGCNGLQSMASTNDFANTHFINSYNGKLLQCCNKKSFTRVIGIRSSLNSSKALEDRA